MKRMILTLLALCAAAFSVSGQTDWKKVQKLLSDGSYRTAYATSHEAYASNDASARERLTAAYFMSQAGAFYLEDAADSSRSQLQALLPTLQGVDKAICHALLGEYAAALEEEQLLKKTPVEEVRLFCNEGATENMTPTVYDMLVVQMQDRGSLSAEEKVQWQQRLLRFHHRSEPTDIEIYHTLRLLNLMEEVPNRPLRLDTVQHYINTFRHSGSPYLSQLYYKAATHCSHYRLPQAVRYCDSGIALNRKSLGAVECARYRSYVLSKTVTVDDGSLLLYPSRETPFRLEYKNVEKVYMRLLAAEEQQASLQQWRKKLSKRRPLKEWTEMLPADTLHLSRSAILTIPALEGGEYILLASTEKDFSDEFAICQLRCTDAALFHIPAQGGLLLDGRNGHPIGGQKMDLFSTRYVRGEKVEKLVESVLTAADGRFSFVRSVNEGWGTVQTERGCKIEMPWNEPLKRAVQPRLSYILRHDRPIYHPADTLYAALVLFRTDGLEGKTAEGIEVEVEMRDVNLSVVGKTKVQTDDFGVASFEMPIPADHLPGYYTLSFSTSGQALGQESIRVEEYRQPRFAVVLSRDSSTAPAFGRELRIDGRVESYTELPTSGARVQYSIRRSAYSRFGWLRASAETTLSEGETTTDADGSFHLSFVPQIDSSVELSTHPFFSYTVEVSVSDLNGESHSSQLSVRIGFRNAQLSLGDDLSPLLTSLDGKPLPSKVQMRVWRLQPPARRLIDLPYMGKAADSIFRSLPEAEWAEKFPFYAPDGDYNDPSTWPTAKEEKGSAWKKQSGTFRIMLTSAEADTLIEYRTLTAVGERYVQQRGELIWSDVSRRQAEVGDSIELRFGSPLDETEIYCLVRVGDSLHTFRHVGTHGQRIVRMPIHVDSSMLGGFDIELLSVREGLTARQSHHIDVPFSHKQLQLHIGTFRDRLQPGEEEEWTLSVSGERGNVPSALILTMYDAALNSYGGATNWSFSPWRRNHASILQQYRPNPFNWGLYLREPVEDYGGVYPTVWSIKELSDMRWYGHRRLYKTASRASMQRLDAVNEMALTVEEEDVETEEDAAEALGTAAEPPTEDILRSDLRTLAFFSSSLRTGADTAVLFRFRIPELLTRWDIRAMAIGRGLESGYEERSIVCRKRLMVQPNMPRFLRERDTLSFLFRLTAEDATPTPVQTTLLLTDAERGDTLCLLQEETLLSGSAQASFHIDIPEGVHLLRYRILTQAEGMSDGEQGELPVLSVREVSTASASLFAASAGEKRSRLAEWEHRSESREPLMLTAELTARPGLLALKSMPYIQDQENPSSLFLAHLWQVNQWGRNALEEAGEAIAAALLADAQQKPTSSPLLRLEEEKSSPLLATPWSRCAESEEQQRETIRAFFDTAALEGQMRKAVAEIGRRQNSDGGWSWMPDGRSNRWVTMQVLQKMQGSGINEERALEYVDREYQREYELYVKPYLKRQSKTAFLPATDYLFMRSAFGKAKTEAYRYYYSQALKHYKNTEDLHTQARLAVVFYRGGDRKAAADLLRRIKEKSLGDEESGLYWRENVGRRSFFRSAAQVQAEVIEAFCTVSPSDSVSIGLMQQWLLRQKHTNHWDNECATAMAIQALLAGGYATRSGAASLTIFGREMDAPKQGAEEYASQRWNGSELQKMQQGAENGIVLKKEGAGLAWGAVYYQYADRTDQIDTSSTGFRLHRSYTVGGRELRIGERLKVGDRLKVRIEIESSIEADYVELSDERAACMEPLSTAAGYAYSAGLGYYIAVGNTANHFYIEHLPKGRYCIEYEVYITLPGSFLTGKAQLQCMYAPEFRSVLPGRRVEVQQR